MPAGVRAIAVLMAIGTVIAVAAAVTLLVPGTPLDFIWNLKAAAYREMLPFRWLAGAGFLLLAVATLSAALGLWRGRRWGWAVAVAILALNGLSDIGRAVSGDVAGGIAGVLIAGALVAYLVRRSIRARFS
jgi:hypothetical protein